MTCGHPIKDALQARTTAGSSKITNDLIEVLAADGSRLCVEATERRRNSLERPQTLLDCLSATAFNQEYFGTRQRCLKNFDSLLCQSGGCGYHFDKR